MTTHLLQPDAAVLDHTIATRPVIEITDGVIRAIHSDAVGGAGERLRGTLLPGFVDLQVNGAGGRGCDEADPEAFALIDSVKISDQQTWAHLAVSGEELFIRELNALSAFRWTANGP